MKNEYSYTAISNSKFLECVPKQINVSVG